MKKNKISIMLFIGLFSFVFSSSAMAIPTVSLDLVNSPQAIGDTFDVQVWVDGDDIDLVLLGFGFDVGFGNGGVFGFTGFTLGDAFDDDSFGDGNVAGSVFPGIMDDDVLLATLTFETLTFGTDSINVVGGYEGGFSGIYYELFDWELTGYDVDAALSLTVTDSASPVPEPTTVFLIATGLFGLAGFNRQRRI